MCMWFVMVVGFRGFARIINVLNDAYRVVLEIFEADNKFSIQTSFINIKLVFKVLKIYFATRISKKINFLAYLNVK